MRASVLDAHTLACPIALQPIRVPGGVKSVASIGQSADDRHLYAMEGFTCMAYVQASGAMAPAEELDDAAFIEASWREPGAFGTVFDRYFVAIYRYARMRLGPDLADDIAAETFLVAFRRRKRYDLAHPNARPWLFGIATNLIRGHRRNELRMYRAFARATAVLITNSHEERVSEQVTAEAAQSRLAAGLATLPPGDRDVLLLVASAQLSYAETARVLGIPVGTVASRLNRARAKVRAALGGTDPTCEQPAEGSARNG